MPCPSRKGHSTPRLCEGREQENDTRVKEATLLKPQKISGRRFAAAPSLTTPSFLLLPAHEHPQTKQQSAQSRELSPSLRQEPGCSCVSSTPATSARALAK